jgi:hypothetical protein
MNTADHAKHPLFDEDGYYHLATQQSIWRDGGQRCMVGFLAAHARSALRERWLYGEVLKQQPWRFPGGIPDSDVHQFLSHSRESASRAEDEARGRFGTLGHGVAPREAVPTWRAVPQGGRTVSLVAYLRPDSMPQIEDRTGAAAAPDCIVGIRPHSGPSTVTLLIVAVHRVPARRQAIVFLFPDALFIRLAQLVLGTGTDDPSDWYRVLERALHPAALDPPDPSPEARRRALDLATLFALAPAVGGTTTSQGLDLAMDLPSGCEDPGPRVWRIVCIEGSSS